MSLTLMSPFPYSLRSGSLIRISMNQSEIRCCFQAGTGYNLTLRGTDTRNPFCSRSVPQEPPRGTGSCFSQGCQSRDARTEGFPHVHEEEIKSFIICGGKMGQGVWSGLWFCHVTCPTGRKRNRPVSPGWFPAIRAWQIRVIPCRSSTE